MIFVWEPVVGSVYGSLEADSSEVASGDGVEDLGLGTVDDAYIGSLTSTSIADPKDDPCHGIDDARGKFPPESPLGLASLVSRLPKHMRS